MNRWRRYLNIGPTKIKENSEKHFFRTDGSLCNVWACLIFSFQLLSALLCGSNMPCVVISISKLTDYYKFFFFFFFFFFQKFPGIFKALFLLLLSAQMRQPPSTTSSQAQMLLLNCLQAALLYAITTSSGSLSH